MTTIEERADRGEVFHCRQCGAPSRNPLPQAGGYCMRCRSKNAALEQVRAAAAPWLTM